RRQAAPGHAPPGRAAARRRPRARVRLDGARALALALSCRARARQVPVAATVTRGARLRGASATLGETKGDLAEPSVTLDGGMVTIRRPIVAHPSRALRVLERVVEEQDRDALLDADRVHELVQAPDRALRRRPAVIPGEDVGEGHDKAQLASAPHHPAEP